MSESEGVDPPKEPVERADETADPPAPAGTQSVPEGAEGAAAAPAAEPSPAEAAAAERSKLKDQLLRTAADFDNFRKRARKDVEDAARRGREDTVRELLPIADNLERAISAAEKSPDVKVLVDGVRMVLKLFEDALDKVGVSRIKAVGERFDPSLHDAIQQVESADAPPGTIVQELVPGYKMGDRLVRAAMVAVARPPSEKS